MQGPEGRPVPNDLAQIVERLERIEQKMREREKAELEALADQIRILGKDPNDYLDS